MRYTDEQLTVLRGTSIVQVMFDLVPGLKRQRTASGLFFSPFRDERTPSFHINETSNMWFDHGDPSIGRRANKSTGGGDVIDLVQLLRRCSFPDACRYLSSFHPNMSLQIETVGGGRYDNSRTRTIIDTVHPNIKDSQLLKYITEKRKVSPEALGLVKEVHYHNDFFSVERETGEETITRKDYKAIGFPNIDGNWALRGTLSKSKRSTGSNYSVISSQGEFIMSGDERLHRPQSRSVCVFEGFMDALSLLSMLDRSVPESCDFIVLNSVSNVKKSIPLISRYTNVFCYLDADEAGQNATKEIGDALAQIPSTDHEVFFRDFSQKYDGCNDLNDFYVKKKTIHLIQEPQQIPSSPSKGIR